MIASLGNSFGNLSCSGFSFDEVYSMPVWLRKFYLSELAEIKKAESGTTKESTQDIAGNMQRIQAIQDKISSKK